MSDEMCDKKYFLAEIIYAQYLVCTYCKENAMVMSLKPIYVLLQ